MSFRMPNVQLSKLQWAALILGTPLVLGVGYYVLKDKNQDDDSSRPQPAELEKSRREKLEAKSNAKNTKQENVEKNPPKENMTPLEAANAYKNEGNLCFRNGKFADAIAKYDMAIEKCPAENTTDMAIFYQNRAAAYEMLKKWSAVKNDCTKSLDNNPKYAKAYMRRAKAHEATNDMLACLDDITATCILEMFQNDNTIAFADRVLKQTGREMAEAAIKDRTFCLPSNSFIRTYLRSFVNDPIQIPVNGDEVLAEPKGYARAKLAMEQQQFDEIINDCTEEIESTESESAYQMEALLMRGTFNLLSGSFENALADLNAVINNSTDDFLRSHALIKRASLNIQLEQKDESLADFALAEKLAPHNADIYHQRAQIYILLERLDESLEEFKKVLALAPDHAMAFVQKCYAEYRYAINSQDQMRLEKAMSEFRRAIEKFPDCVECYSLMAQVLSDQQQFEQAEHYYEKAIKIAPHNASLYVHHGVMLLQWKGDVDAACRLMEQAIKVDDKCELAYETLGTIEVQRANLTHAIELFDKSIKLAKSKAEMCHLYSLRNAAIAQLNVTKKFGINMQALQDITQQNMMAAMQQ